MSRNSTRASKPTLHIVSHTHWDREWYLSFERFRFRLVDLIDELIEIFEREPGFRFFQLDGQTIILEDYLAIRPEHGARLRQLIREGRIQIGPWHVQNDLFLTTGEATIRNLLIGTGICREQYGTEPMGVAYVPDQFGVISQLPQIAAGFGLRAIVFGRAYDNSAGPEFIWEGPDGTRVFSVHLFQWYNNAQRIPADAANAVEMLDKVTMAARLRTALPHLLLMNGVDHLNAQENLAQVLDGVRRQKPNFEVRHSTLEQYLAAAKASLNRSAVYRGEMRSGDNGSVLPGTASTRIHLKQLNVELQHGLQAWAEPFAVMAEAWGMKYDSRGMIRHAWKALIQNHAHDSICGCSVDEVHFQMEARFRAVRDMVREILDRCLGYIASAVPPTAGTHSVLAVFNPECAAGGRIVEADLDLLEGEDLGEYEIAGPDGDTVPTVLLGSRPLVNHVLMPKRLPHRLRVTRHRLLINAGTLPAAGYKALTVRRNPGRGQTFLAAKSKAAPRGGTRSKPPRLSNEFLTVQFHGDGTFDLRCKNSGRRFSRLHAFEDQGERGDEYISMRPKHDETFSSTGKKARVTLVEDNGLRQAVRVEVSLRIPSCLDARMERRTGKPVAIRIESTVSLTTGEPFLRVRTRLENLAKDHRLRVVFPTNCKTSTAFADSPFDVVARPIDMKTANRGNEHPMATFCGVEDGTGGVAVFARGLPEYEVYPAGAAIAVTLLRCVDILGDMPPEFWDKQAMENDRTPDAQCLRLYEFDYAVCPFAGSWETAEIPALASRFAHGTRVVQVPATQDGWTGTRFAAQELLPYWEDETTLPVRPSVALPSTGSLVACSNTRVQVTAIKFPAASKQARKITEAIVRVFNPGSRGERAQLEFGLPVESAAVVSLGESNPMPLKVSAGRAIAVQANPREILTLRVAFRRVSGS